MTRDNKKWEVDDEMQDFDFVSLYPSAMYRLGGFLKGRPKVLCKHQLNIDFLNSVDGYFVEIKINNVGDRRHFPQVNYKDPVTGVRQFDNDFRGRMIVDKFTLEDLIEFQQIEFDVLKGYYFDEGRNPRLKDCIEFLFEERNKKKAEGNPIQVCYKLLMNSAYGRTIMKARESEYVFKNDYPNKKGVNEFMVYMKNNFNSILHAECVTELNDPYRRFAVKVKQDVLEHFSSPHCGSEILGMSKRITNEVMYLAEDMGVFIAYTDTDSMHIENARIKDLEEAFKEKYGRQLVGKSMGQAHCDFEVGQDKGTMPVSRRSFFLGKKAYIDELEYVKDEQKQTGYHIRMKGISTAVIKNKENVMQYYEELYRGASKTEDLCELRPRFEYTSFGGVRTKESMQRSISFPGECWHYDGKTVKRVRVEEQG